MRFNKSNGVSIGQLSSEIRAFCDTNRLVGATVMVAMPSILGFIASRYKIVRKEETKKLNKKEYPFLCTTKCQNFHNLTEYKERHEGNKCLITVSHNGNMGDTLKMVDVNLAKMHPNLSIETIKKAGIVRSEKGSPDYHYILRVVINKTK